MKLKTVIKILKRYEKNLNFLMNEAKSKGLIADAEQYQCDLSAMKEAIKCVTNYESENERSCTES